MHDPVRGLNLTTQHRVVRTSLRIGKSVTANRAVKRWSSCVGCALKDCLTPKTSDPFDRFRAIKRRSSYAGCAAIRAFKRRLNGPRVLAARRSSCVGCALVLNDTKNSGPLLIAFNPDPSFDLDPLTADPDPF